MSPDELKALIEAVKAVSGDAREVLLWYFGAGLAKSVMWVAFWLMLFSRILTLLRQLAAQGNASSTIARHLGLDPDMDRSDRENRQIHQWVRDAIAREHRP